MAGNPLFGVDIAKLIFDNMNGQLLDCTLHVVTAGTRTPGDLGGGTNPTEADKTAQGFIDSKNRRDVAGTLIEDGEVIIVLIGNSIQDEAVPKVGDKVTIEAKKYNIRALDRDPAAATYTLVCKSV